MFPFYRVRLQQLERESEDLDQSFQAYLRRQQISKQQMTDDATKIWENYSLSKAAIEKYNMIEDKLGHTTAYHSKLAMNMTPIMNSTFQDDIDIEELLNDLNEIKRLKSPQFNRNEAFAKKSIFPSRDQETSNHLKVDMNSAFEKQKIFHSQIKEILPESLVQKQMTNETTEIEKEKENNEEQKTAEPVLSFVSTNEHSAHVKNSSQTRATISNLPKQNRILDETFGDDKQPEISFQTSSMHKSEKKIETITNGKKISHDDTTKNEANLQKVEHKIICENEEKIDVKASSQKINGFETPKTNGVSNLSLKNEKVPQGNGMTKISKMNTISTNKFTPIASGSDSNAESEQISIGAQRLVKSPDDFWI